MKKKIILTGLILFAIGGFWRYSNYKNVICNQKVVTASAVSMTNDYQICGDDFKLINRDSETIKVEKVKMEIIDGTATESKTLDTFNLDPNQGIKPDLKDDIVYKFVDDTDPYFSAQIQLTTK